MKQEQRLEHEQVSQVFDSGRRGAPRPGCDCEQCFGYCFGFIDQDALIRAMNTGREFQQGIPDIDGPVDMILDRPSYDEG
jgi:hypothetical protein